jgi:hypothetical protein
MTLIRLDDDDELEPEDDIEDDVEIATAVFQAGLAIAAAAYRIPAFVELECDATRVRGRTMLAAPYEGRRHVKARSYFLRLTQYATTVLCGRAAMHLLLGHDAGCEHDAADAAPFIEARARRRVREPERKQIVERELRPRAARLLSGKREAVMRVAAALIRHQALTSKEVRALVYPRSPKPH